jgi:hypothetical protein
LGQHEIATIQATAVDHAAGFVNVTTTLAHSVTKELLDRTLTISRDHSDH